MSHLSTIISRVKGKEHYSEQDLKEDILFEQAIINLMEYLKSWKDYTAEEKAEAIRLYDKHRNTISGNRMPSHRQRLKEADVIRAKV